VSFGGISAGLSGKNCSSLVVFLNNADFLVIVASIKSFVTNRKL
jgi:hypothetical protein